MADVIISTGDVKKDYEVLDTICALGQSEAGLLFTSDYAIDHADEIVDDELVDAVSNALAPDNAFKEAKSELISKCKILGGNAVIFCQFEYRITGSKPGVEIFAYGTAVRMK